MSDKKEKEIDNQEMLKDKYKILGKDPAMSYKFVGPKRKDDYLWDGWSLCKKEEHPDLKVSGDRNSSSDKGLFEVGPFILMCISVKDAKAKRDDNEKRNLISEGAVKGNNKNFGRISPMTIDVTQNKNGG